MIKLTRLGCVNIHASLLPRWRGASPIQASILSGDLKSGITIQKMVLELDAGDVLYSKELLLPAGTTSPWLLKKLATMGAESFLALLGEIEKTNTLPAGKPQNSLDITYCQKIQKHDGKINWQQGSDVVYKHYCAYLGWPGAFSYLPSGERLMIHEAKPLPGHEALGSPGEIFFSDKKSVLVACGSGALELIWVQREGRKKTKASDLAGSSVIKAGDYLGS